MFLNKSDFSNVIKNTPLVAIDLCVLKGREILLGKRINPPAKNFYFVPGGRILKSELIRNALKRILNNELGLTPLNDKEIYIKSLGLYEHFYEDNFQDNNNFSTHYVVAAYAISYESLIKKSENILSEQHSHYVWLNIDIVENCSLDIHKNTIEYINYLKLHGL